MRHSSTLVIVFSILALSLLPTPAGADGISPTAPRRGAWRAAWMRHWAMEQTSSFRNLPWRAVGPKFQGGRIESVCSVPGKPSILFAGAGAGSLWKSVDSGITWRCVFAHEASFSIGDVAVAPSDRNRVWLGTGENLRGRGYAFAGTGVYRSDDGGETWRNTGLENSHHIGRVVVDPANPDRVFVAALGPFWSEGGQRGLYRTLDGGANWERVLDAGPVAGVVDVVMDPSDPDILYAVTWRMLNGMESGVWRTVNGGDNWERLAGGLPEGSHVGRIGLAVAVSDPEVVYAFVDNRGLPGGKKAEKKGKRPAGGHRRDLVGAQLFRSEDRGLTWRKTHEEELAIYPGFGWAFGDVRVSPDNADQVYVLGVRMLRSDDGGKTFEAVGNRVVHQHPNRAVTLHLDQHDLWIDPEDPDRLVLGNDGGLYLSVDRGRTWQHRNSLPIAEFYTIAVDESRTPYRVLGGNQDNSCVYGPAEAPLMDGVHDGWAYVWLDPWSGGDGFVTLADPTNPDVIYYESQNGHLNRKNFSTGEKRFIKPRAAKGKPALKTNWLTPYFVSPHNPLTLYYGADRVMKSLNRGDDWRATGPSITSALEAPRKSNACSALAESPLIPGLLVAGTEKGILKVSRDDGRTWTDRSMGLPVRHVKSVAASRFDANRIYVALTGIDRDDFTPHVYRTDDLGATWRSLAAGLPDECVNAILEDPTDARILYLGTDKGVYVSLDGGASWLSLSASLPTVSVQALALAEKAGELVIGTHGMSAFVLDVKPIRAYLKKKVWTRNCHLYPVTSGRLPRSRDSREDRDLATGRPVRITFHLNAPARVEVILLDEAGAVARSWFHEADVDLNRITWDGSLRDRPEQGPYYIPGRVYAAPGTYRVNIKGEGIELNGTFELED